MIDRRRWLGNALTIVGYGFILHVDPLIGSGLKILGFSLVIPSVIKYKMYDVVALATVFIALDLSNILRILLR